MYNKLLDLLKKLEYGFRTAQIDTIGKRILTTVTEALWYLDPQWELLSSRSIKMPDLFQELRGFNDWHAQKKKKPKVSDLIQFRF